MRNAIVGLVAAGCALLWLGCQQVVSLPPRITLAEIQPSGRAAKPRDCKMPVLRAEPLRDFRKVAILEGLANYFAEEKDVLPLIRRKACETGADAIVVVESKRQTSEAMTGYYVNAIAIVYGKVLAPPARSPSDSPSPASASTPAHDSRPQGPSSG